VEAHPFLGGFLGTSKLCKFSKILVLLPGPNSSETWARYQRIEM